MIHHPENRPSFKTMRDLTTGDMTGVLPADVALPIYKEACRILKLPKPDRRAEIERHPLSELLAAEVIRLHKFRRTVVCTPTECAIVRITKTK